MLKKTYHCEIPGCGRVVQIRSTIKTGEHKGSKACGGCKNKLEPKKPKLRKPIAKSNPKAREKRSEERSGLPEYFQQGIALLKKAPYCQNCGTNINVGFMPANNVCHILSKRKYKSVMANPYNRIFLCSSKDNVNGKGCHEEFDSKIKNRPSMPVFQTVLLLYASFKEGVTEWGVEREIIENVR